MKARVVQLSSAPRSVRETMRAQQMCGLNNIEGFVLYI